MIKHLPQKFVLLVSSIVLGTIAIETKPAQADLVEYQFTADLVESLFLEGAPEINLEPNPDLYTGTFTFDDDFLTGIGFESVGAEAGLLVSLNDDPRVNQDVDPRFPEFPTVNFQDGKLLGLDWFAVYHPFTNVPELDYPGDFVRISGTDLTDGFDPTFYTEEDEPRSPVLGFGTVTYTKVPEPSIMAGLAMLTLFGGFVKRTKHN
jgi:hypothetical protein